LNKNYRDKPIVPIFTDEQIRDPIHWLAFYFNGGNGTSFVEARDRLSIELELLEIFKRQL